MGGEASAPASPRFGRRMRLRYSSAALCTRTWRPTLPTSLSTGKVQPVEDLDKIKRDSWKNIAQVFQNLEICFKNNAEICRQYKSVVELQNMWMENNCTAMNFSAKGSSIQVLEMARISEPGCVKFAQILAQPVLQISSIFLIFFLNFVQKI